MSEGAEKTTLRSLARDNYLDVTRNDGEHVAGVVELDQDAQGRVQGLLVTREHVGGKAIVTYVPWHAVSALNVVNERGKTGDE